MSKQFGGQMYDLPWQILSTGNGEHVIVGILAATTVPSLAIMATWMDSFQKR